MVFEQFGDLVADEIAQHPAEGAGDHAHHDRHDRRLTCDPRQMCARGAKQAETDRVGNLEPTLTAFESAATDQGRKPDADRDHADQHALVFHPKKRPAIEQHVAQRAATEGGEKAADANTDDVHALA